MGTNWGRAKWALVASGFVFSLAIVTFLSIVSATTGSWDFNTSTDYTYDSAKVEFTSGFARLKKNFTVTQDTEALFDAVGGSNATYSNTQSSITPDRVDIISLVGATLTAPAPGT